MIRRLANLLMPGFSLPAKLLITTSLVITALFAVTGWIVQDRSSRLTALSLEEEVQNGFRAYDSLWRAREEMLSSISLILSRMPDVRAAFSTGDAATIRDTAGEIWSRMAREDAIFLVSDPRGAVIASLGRTPDRALKDLPFVRGAARRFPKQSSGFLMLGGTLYQTVVTPVYVNTATDPALINVLVAGYAVDRGVAERLQSSTGNTHFEFIVNGTTVAGSSEAAPESSPFARQLRRPLLDLDGNPIGELRISRSFDAARQHLNRLRRDVFVIWAAALGAGLLLIFFLARQFLRPLAELDLAARQIAQGDFAVTLPIRSADEIGRLAQSFNSMSRSLSEARQELIRQERIQTIARLSTSLVHDLRNPLAAIYGGAEMLVDSNLNPSQVKRLASNIYKSSRRIQEMLQDLLQVSREPSDVRETCRLVELVRGAADECLTQTPASRLSIQIDVPEEIELVAVRSRLERVFLNLLGNAAEAMPNGGEIRIAAARDELGLLVSVTDNGPGVPEHIRSRLFQPFVTAGKRSGMGLGLALSRQTVLDHGGDLWLDTAPQGARFCLRLP
ncbi:MAG: HAMP domain-containing protein [Acidobacteria bacterium]|nr:HAMP domain-containing protein [Acidobacteriota bacterium]